jgi:carboxylesterase type B
LNKNTKKNQMTHYFSLCVSLQTAGIEDFAFVFIAARLFQRAILQSGSALSPWAISFDAVSCTQWLAVNVNCSQYLSDSKKLVSCLRNKTATELVEKIQKKIK